MNERQIKEFLQFAPALMRGLPRNEIYLLIEIMGDVTKKLDPHPRCNRVNAHAVVYNIRTGATSDKAIRKDKNGRLFVQGERGDWLRNETTGKFAWSRPSDKYFIDDFKV